jgi:hypothetical protein
VKLHQLYNLLLLLNFVEQYILLDIQMQYNQLLALFVLQDNLLLLNYLVDHKILLMFQ